MAKTPSGISASSYAGRVVSSVALNDALKDPKTTVGAERDKLIKLAESTMKGQDKDTFEKQVNTYLPKDQAGMKLSDFLEV